MDCWVVKGYLKHIKQLLEEAERALNNGDNIILNRNLDLIEEKVAELRKETII